MYGEIVTKGGDGVKEIGGQFLCLCCRLKSADRVGNMLKHVGIMGSLIDWENGRFPLYSSLHSHKRHDPTQLRKI